MVRWIARVGVTSIGQVRQRFGLGRAVAYELCRRLIEADLLERMQTLPGDPSLLLATRQGIRYSGLGLPAVRLRIGEIDHWLACTDLAIELEANAASSEMLTEREILFEEERTRKPLASARVGETPAGYWRLHRPDLARVNGDEVTVYEIELTQKSRSRLDTIVSAWARSRHIERCVYLCPPGPVTTAVREAIERKHCEELVEVRELRR